MVVKLVRYYEYPDIKRQTPNQSFTWGEYTFTEDEVAECDYLIILDHPKHDFSVRVRPSNIIHICQEPPNENSLYRQYGNRQNSLIINQIDTKQNNLLLHGALPWHIDKDYDFLVNLKPETLNKQNKISWITSTKNSTKGHMQRMQFLNRIKDIDFVHLYGRGIQNIDDKWDALFDAKYSIAYENYSNDYYWTEKISDAYLSYAMPIYFGCRKISDFFPKDSYIQIDPKDKHISLFFKELINSDSYEKALESIGVARGLILNKYQLFPYLIDIIEEKNRSESTLENNPELLHFKGGDDYFDNYPNSVALKKQISKLKRKVIKLLKD